MLKHPKGKKIIKWFLFITGALLLIGAGVYFYLATLTYQDTSKLQTDFAVEALSFIKEFETDYKAANSKYAEKIIEVTGVVSETEAADTTMNIKMTDSLTGSYLIFAFQKQHLQEAKTLNPGDRVTIKGSCSDGVYSEILGSYFISFKRSTLSK